MYLHIRIRPDGNGSIYVGDFQELIKRYNALRRAHERDNLTPFSVVYRVEVRDDGGSSYYLINDSNGDFSICKRGKYAAQFVGYSYHTFSGAVKRLARLIYLEGGAR